MVLYGILLLLIVGAAAPFLSADRYRQRIQAALESALQRKAHLGAVRFTLLTGPGFTVKDVLIEDDPSAGLEPFAYVAELEARIGFASLWSGRLVFSTIRLNEPTVNLVKPAHAPWNVQPFLAGLAAGVHPAQAVPEIQVRDARINFKFGAVKTVYYVNNASVDLYRNGPAGLSVRFSGEPARTDGTSKGLASIGGRGTLRPDGRIELGVHLDRTQIAGLTALAHGQQLGLHGNLAVTAQLSGTLPSLAIVGTLSIDDLHRWDVTPSHGEAWTVPFRGSGDLRAETLHLEAASPESAAPSFTAHLEASDFLRALQWSFETEFHDIPAAPLVETARHMGAPIPESVSMGGIARGKLRLSNRAQLQGTVAFDRATVKVGNAATARIGDAEIVFQPEGITFGPAVVELPSGREARVEVRYAMREPALDVKIESEHLGIGEIAGPATSVLGAPPPLLDLGSVGEFRGSLAFHQAQDKPGAWSGAFELRNAVLDLPGIRDPVRIISANVTAAEEDVKVSRVHGRAGKLVFDGDAQFSPDGRGTERFHLTVAEADAADLESELLPALRRDQSFLARLRRRTTVPEWLAHRKLDGVVQIRRLLSGDDVLGGVSGRVLWQGTEVICPRIDWRGEDARGAGTLRTDLSGAVPRYRWSGRLFHLDYHGGQLDVAGKGETAGIGSSLSRNLRAQGTFAGQSIPLAPDAEMQEISGAFRITGVRIALTKVQAVQGTEVLSGEGAGIAGGKLTLDLGGPRRQVRYTSTLFASAEPRP